MGLVRAFPYLLSIFNAYPLPHPFLSNLHIPFSSCLQHALPVGSVSGSAFYKQHFSPCCLLHCTAPPVSHHLIGLCLSAPPSHFPPVPHHPPFLHTCLLPSPAPCSLLFLFITLTHPSLSVHLQAGWDFLSRRSRWLGGTWDDILCPTSSLLPFEHGHYRAFPTHCNRLCLSLCHSDKLSRGIYISRPILIMYGGGLFDVSLPRTRGRFDMMVMVWLRRWTLLSSTA